MFNLHEPGEEEMSEFRKEQRRKNRIRIDTNDWSRVPRCACNALLLLAAVITWPIIAVDHCFFVVVAYCCGPLLLEKIVEPLIVVASSVVDDDDVSGAITVFTLWQWPSIVVIVFPSGSGHLLCCCCCCFPQPCGSGHL